MTRRPFPIPSWAPPVAAAALALWAVSIWWMVATLPSGGDTAGVEQGLSTIAEEVEAARVSITTLSEEVAALRAERDDLLARLDDLDALRPLASAFEMSPDAGDAAEGVTEEAHPLFTDGEDRYNCIHFSAMEEAQEALRVNGPGDPNRIDMNGNGEACEDFRYPEPVTGVSP